MTTYTRQSSASGSLSLIIKVEFCAIDWISPPILNTLSFGSLVTFVELDSCLITTWPSFRHEGVQSLEVSRLSHKLASDRKLQDDSLPMSGESRYRCTLAVVLRLLKMRQLRNWVNGI